MKIREFKVSNEQIKLWPYSKEQVNKIPLIDSRLSEWRVLVHEIHAFLCFLHSHETITLAEFGKLKNAMEKRVIDKDEIHDITSLWYQYALSNQKDHASWVSSLNCLCQEIYKLMDQIKMKQKTYIHDTNKWVNQIKSERDNMLNSIEKQNSIRSCDSITDPWLNERVLHLQMDEMIQKENQFQKRILFILEDITKFDKFIINELKRIFEKFAADDSMHSVLVQGHFSNYRSAIAIMDADSSFNTFATQNKIFENELWNKERTLETFPFHAQETNVIKKGCLMRPATFTKWKSSYFVLTFSGYLHCFDGNSKRLKTLSNENENQEWKSIESKLNLRFSINLSCSRTRIDMMTGDNDKNMFEITIPRKKTLLCSAESQKWIFKADSEEEMVDWIVDIKKKIETFVPDGPPSPILEMNSQALAYLNNDLTALDLHDDKLSSNTQSVSLPKTTVDFIKPQFEGESFNVHAVIQ